MAIVCQPAVESLDALKSLAPSAYYRSATDDLSGPWLGDTGIDLLEDLTTSWTGSEFLITERKFLALESALLRSAG
jgi:hypothetical protein